MKTKDHKYLANVFYHDDTINKIMSSNYFVEIEEKPNLDDIIIDTGVTGQMME